MTAIIILPPAIILELDDVNFCDGCLMAQTIAFGSLFCPVLNRRVEMKDGRHPRPPLCHRAYLRDAREEETDRDAEEMIGLVPICPECGEPQNLPWYDTGGDTCPGCGTAYTAHQRTIYDMERK